MCFLKMTVIINNLLEGHSNVQFLADGQSLPVRRKNYFISHFYQLDNRIVLNQPSTNVLKMCRLIGSPLLCWSN